MKKIDTVIRQCVVCNKDILKKRIHISQYKKSKYCSIKCRGIGQSKINIGEKNPNYRGGVSKCSDCNVLLKYRYMGKIETRCKPCYYKFATGENSPVWKGGITKYFPQCINCSGDTKDKQSMLCKNCYKGALHPLWRGGTSTIQGLIRALPENRQWIKQCMYRDNYTCQECGVASNGNNLQVHHIEQFALILRDNNINSIEDAKSCEKLWSTHNGITLCKSCHKLTESFNKKVN